MAEQEQAEQEEGEEESVEEQEAQADLEDARVRLNTLWSDQGIELPTAEATAQTQALEKVIEWLRGFEKDRTRAVRATQYLLCDPQRPGSHKRAAWNPLKKALLGAWGNVGVSPNDIRLLQALLQAAWPLVPPHFRSVAECFVSAAPLTAAVGSDASWWAWPTDDSSQDKPEPLDGSEWTPLRTALAALQTRKAAAAVPAPAPANPPAGQQPDPIPKAIGDVTKAVALGVDALERRHAALVDFFWWGQARYSRTLRSPYRRLSAIEATFWVPWEGSGASASARVEVDSACAYVAETVHSLGHDLAEQKPLSDWMIDFSSSLRGAGTKITSVAGPLEELARIDALALPVTWLRLQGETSWSVADAAAAVALDLGHRVARGDWIQWIVRELTLEQRLRE